MTIATVRLQVRFVRSADDRPFIPVEAEPSHPFENALDHFVRRALGVGVLDAQDEDAAVTPREEPVEERRSRAADVKITGRGRSESNAGSGHGRQMLARSTFALRATVDSLRWLAIRRSPGQVSEGWR